MKSWLLVLLAGLIGAAFATIVTAMPTGMALEKGPGAYPMDCEKAKDKARCAALNKKVETCKGKTDDDWLECMYPSAPTANFTPPKPRDCTKALNKDLCEAHTRALEACKEKHTRAEHRKCMAGQLQAGSSKKN